MCRRRLFWEKMLDRRTQEMLEEEEDRQQRRTDRDRSAEDRDSDANNDRTGTLRTEAAKRSRSTRGPQATPARRSRDTQLPWRRSSGGDKWTSLREEPAISVQWVNELPSSCCKGITFLCVRASTSDKRTVPLSETGEVMTELNIDDTEMAYVDPSNDRNHDPFHMMPVYNALMKHLKLPKGEHLLLQTQSTSAEVWVAGIGGNKDVRRRAAKLALCGTANCLRHGRFGTELLVEHITGVREAKAMREFLDTAVDTMPVLL